MARLPIARLASLCLTALLVVQLPEAVFSKSKSKAHTHDKGEISIDKKGNNFHSTVFTNTVLLTC